ncbi:PIN domain-containing protein [Streptomyces hygroscopicus]|uniref:PIN domain-containing protein n=1 Tax=Streptomyces hygroscopicus TaxID=1912 RepID=UPI000AE893F3|nr:PIN domain-containing protein [Streptomyces hygroscopicus]
MSDNLRGSFVDGYEGYWRRSASSVEDAISSSSIILDTNALLGLYRMDSVARGEYLNVLQNLAPRIWVPRQVLDEFHKNRLSALDSHMNALTEKSQAVEGAVNELENKLRDFAKLRSLSGRQVADYMRPLQELTSEISRRVEVDVKSFDLSAGQLASSDPILERLSALLDGRVGDKVNLEEIERRKALAVHRGSQEVPPGYKDYKKRGDDGVGDCLIWLEILDYAKVEKRPILFVSSDTKEDWMRYQCGLVIGPRPELIEEMRQVAGVEYHHVTLPELLSRVGAVLMVSVSQETIDQAKHVQEHEERTTQLINQRNTLAEEGVRISREIGAGEEERAFLLHESEWLMRRQRELAHVASSGKLKAERVVARGQLLELAEEAARLEQKRAHQDRSMQALFEKQKAHIASLRTIEEKIIRRGGEEAL